MLQEESKKALNNLGALAIAVGIASISAPVWAKNTTSLTHTVVLENLENPWDMAFLDDGTMFYTETCKGLSVLMPSGESNALLGIGGSEGFASNADGLFCEGQAGMMGVAIGPSFADSRRIFVYSTSNMVTPHTNRLMRLVVSDDFTSVFDRTDIVEDVPYQMKASDHPFRGPGRTMAVASGSIRLTVTCI